jgi:hypothetical protein
MMARPGRVRSQMRLAMAICIDAKEAKHTQRESRGDGEQRSGTSPDDGIRPPWEKEMTRIFRTSVVIRVELLPSFKNRKLPKGTVKDEPVEGIKKEGANSMPSHK